MPSVKAARIAGRSTGSVTRRSVRQSPAPAIRDASSIVTSKDAIAGAMIRYAIGRLSKPSTSTMPPSEYTLNGDACSENRSFNTRLRIPFAGLSRSPQLTAKRRCGIIIGTIASSLKRNLPGRSLRASSHARTSARPVASSVAPTTKTTVSKATRGSAGSVHAATYFASVKWPNAVRPFEKLPRRSMVTGLIVRSPTTTISAGVSPGGLRFANGRAPLRGEDLLELGSPLLDLVVGEIADRDHLRLRDAFDRRKDSRRQHVLADVLREQPHRRLRQPVVDERARRVRMRRFRGDGDRARRSEEGLAAVRRPRERRRRLGDDVLRHRDADRLLAALDRRRGRPERGDEHRTVRGESLDERHPVGFRRGRLRLESDEPRDRRRMDARVRHHAPILPLRIREILVARRRVGRLDLVLVVQVRNVLDAEELNAFAEPRPVRIAGRHRRAIGCEDALALQER